MTPGELKGFKLLGAGLAIPLCLGIPWALFGDVVPDSLMDFFGPKALGRLTVAVVLLSAILLGRGVFTLIREARASADPKAARRKLLWLLLGSSLVSSGISGAIVAYYASQHDAASRICADAEGAPIPVQRQALKDADAALSRVRFFNESVFRCSELERGLEQLERGECPASVPPDARCRCGAQRFPEDWAETGPARCSGFGADGAHLKEPALRRK